MTTSCGWIAILQRSSDIYIRGNIGRNILTVMLWLLYKRNIVSSIGLNFAIGLEFGCSGQYVLLYMGDYIEKLNNTYLYNIFKTVE